VISVRNYGLFWVVLFAIKLVFQYENLQAASMVVPSAIVCVCVCVCVHKSVTVMVEPENEEVEFLWKRFVSMVYYEVYLLNLLFCTSQLHYTQLFSFWTA